jgi:hypothetical protein
LEQQAIRRKEMKHLGLEIRRVGKYIEAKVIDEMEGSLLDQRQLKELQEDVKQILEDIEYEIKE